MSGSLPPHPSLFHRRHHRQEEGEGGGNYLVVGVIRPVSACIDLKSMGRRDREDGLRATEVDRGMRMEVARVKVWDGSRAAWWWGTSDQRRYKIVKYRRGMETWAREDVCGGGWRSRKNGSRDRDWETQAELHSESHAQQDRPKLRDWGRKQRNGEKGEGQTGEQTEREGRGAWREKREGGRVLRQSRGGEGEGWLRQRQTVFDPWSCSHMTKLIVLTSLWFNCSHIQNNIRVLRQYYWHASVLSGEKC